MHNTEKRRSESLQLIDDTLEAGILDKHVAQVLRGRLAFSYAQIFGVSGKSALEEVSAHTFKVPFVRKVSPRLECALRLLRKKLSEGKPRRVSVCALETVVVFTDACFASDFSGGLGGVLVDEAGSLKSWFRLKLSSALVQRLMEKDQEVAIAELESLAALLIGRATLVELSHKQTCALLHRQRALPIWFHQRVLECSDGVQNLQLGK